MGRNVQQIFHSGCLTQVLIVLIHIQNLVVHAYGCHHTTTYTCRGGAETPCKVQEIRCVKPLSKLHPVYAMCQSR